MWKVGNYRHNKHKPKVLICDQESHIRTILQKYLSSVGFSADLAKDGYELLEMASHTHPDVILLDLDMPEMDGQTTIGHLRRMGINVPVLLFSTGSNQFPYDNDSAVLQKPLRPKDIAVVLETLLLETKKEKHFIPRRFKVQ
jgi:two-component system response regulator ResD